MRTVGRFGYVTAVIALLVPLTAASPMLSGELRDAGSGAYSHHVFATRGDGATVDPAYPVMEWTVEVCAAGCVMSSVLGASWSRFESAYWSFTCPCPSQDIGAKDVVRYEDDFVARADCIQDFSAGAGWGHITFWFGLTFPIESCDMGFNAGGPHIVFVNGYTPPYGCAVGPSFRIVIDGAQAEPLSHFLPGLDLEEAGPLAYVVISGASPPSIEHWMVAQCQAMALRR